MPLPAPHVRRVVAALYAVALLASATAQDFQQQQATQTTPLTNLVGLNLVSEYESNVTRAVEGFGSVASHIDSMSLVGAFDHTYSLQRLFVSGEVGRTVYREFPVYDFTGANLTAGWSSTWFDDAHTKVAFTRLQQLVDQAYLTTIRKDVVATDLLNAEADFPLGSPHWHALVAGVGSTIRNSNEIDRITDIDSGEVDAGLRYSSGSSNLVDVYARSVNVRYIHGELSALGDTAYRDRGAAVRTTWRVGATGVLSGSAGYVERRNEHLTFRDFSGPVYELRYNWEPGPKESVLFFLRRAIGDAGQSDFLWAVTHSYRVTPAYKPTERTRLEAYYEWTHFNYFSDTQLLASDSTGYYKREDSIEGLGLAGSWTPRKWITVRLQASHEQRSSTVQNFQFTDHVIQLRAELRL